MDACLEISQKYIFVPLLLLVFVLLLGLEALGSLWEGEVEGGSGPDLGAPLVMAVVAFHLASGSTLWG